MRKNIVRTIATSTVHAVKLEMQDGQPKAITLDPIVLTGKASEKEALKAIKKQHGDALVQVTDIVVSEDVYEISVEDFIKNAKKINSNSAEPEAVEN